MNYTTTFTCHKALNPPFHKNKDIVINIIFQKMHKKIKINVFINQQN